MGSFNLNDDDVVRLDSSENPTETTTSTHREVMQSIWWAVSYRLKEMRRKDSGSFSRIFFQGVNGQVLRPGGVGGWLTGTVRVRLEFTPDEPEEEEEQQESVLLSPVEPESPLDDLRAELNLNNE